MWCFAWRLVEHAVRLVMGSQESFNASPQFAVIAALFVEKGSPRSGIELGSFEKHSLDALGIEWHCLTRKKASLINATFSGLAVEKKQKNPFAREKHLSLRTLSADRRLCCRAWTIPWG
jgi:hypothetical protein